MLKNSAKYSSHLRFFAGAALCAAGVHFALRVYWVAMDENYGWYGDENRVLEFAVGIVSLGLIFTGTACLISALLRNPQILRFGIRGMLVATAILSAWIGFRVKSVHDADRSIAATRQLGTEVHHPVGPLNSRFWGEIAPGSRQRWARVLFGEDYDRGRPLLFGWSEDRGWKVHSRRDGSLQYALTRSEVHDLIPHLKRLGRIEILFLVCKPCNTADVKEIASLANIDEFDLIALEMDDNGLNELVSIIGIDEVRPGKATVGGVEQFRRVRPDIRLMHRGMRYGVGMKIYAIGMNDLGIGADLLASAYRL